MATAPYKTEARLQRLAHVGRTLMAKLKPGAPRRDEFERAVRQHAIQAAERERGRWARELHDGSLQSLAGLRVLLAAAHHDAPPPTAERLGQAIGNLDDTIAEMRRLISDLRPAALDELGLAPSLESLAERLASEGLGVELRVELGGEGEPGSRRRLAPHIEVALYRLVQEALNNVIQHGECDHATVTVTGDEETVRVLVEDEGVGFDANAEHEGFGLSGMRERTALADGRLELRSAPGSGTTVLAELPASYRADSPAGAATGPRPPISEAAGRE